MISNAMLKIVKLGLITAKQVKHVLGSSHRALDTTSRVALNELVDVIPCHQHLIDSGGEPLAQGRHLGGNIVRASSNGLIGELSGQARQLVERGNHFVAH